MTRLAELRRLDRANASMTQEDFFFRAFFFLFFFFFTFSCFSVSFFEYINYYQ